MYSAAQEEPQDLEFGFESEAPIPQRAGSREDGEESWDGDKGGSYPDDDLESDKDAVVTRTAVMKERAAKKAASAMSLTRSWTRKGSGMPDSDTVSPRRSGQVEGIESFTPKRSEVEPGEEPSGPSPRKRSGLSRACACCGCFGCCARLSRVRARWNERCSACSRRIGRCCAPCARCFQLLSRAWAAFEARCKYLAISIRCLCCPLLLLLGAFRCCCGSSAEVPRSSSRSKLSRKGRSMSRSMSRSGSMAVGRSQSIRRSGTLTARFAEGPSRQPRSTLKQKHPRLPKQEQAQKNVSAREKFRELRKEMTFEAGELHGELEDPMANKQEGTLQQGQSHLQLKSLKSGFLE